MRNLSRYLSFVFVLAAIAAIFAAPVSFAGDGKGDCKDKKNCPHHNGKKCKDCKKKCNCKHKDGDKDDNDHDEAKEHEDEAKK